MLGSLNKIPCRIGCPVSAAPGVPSQQCLSLSVCRRITIGPVHCLNQVTCVPCHTMPRWVPGTTGSRRMDKFRVKIHAESPVSRCHLSAPESSLTRTLRKATSLAAAPAVCTRKVWRQTSHLVRLESGRAEWGCVGVLGRSCGGGGAGGGGGVGHCWLGGNDCAGNHWPAAVFLQALSHRRHRPFAALVGRGASPWTI